MGTWGPVWLLSCSSLLQSTGEEKIFLHRNAVESTTGASLLPAAGAQLFAPGWVVVVAPTRSTSGKELFAITLG